MFPPRSKRCSLYFVLGTLVALVFFNEFMIYSIYQLKWASIECRSANCTKILLVSDPQLLGETFDVNFYSKIAIQDSDDDLRKTFSRAISYTKPDVVCFLGDLLDEGSVASDDAYHRYMKRFVNVFATNDKVQKFYIPGDNDIGGERTDYVTAFKTERFRKNFNETNSAVVNNHLRFININLLTHVYPELNETEGISSKFYNIVLSHISVLSYPGLSMKTIMDQFKPNIIFSGHSHHSRIITYPPAHSELLVDKRIFTVDLNNYDAKENYRNFTEIMVPTCSYRMGVANIGYGYAVIDENMLRYTVLWSPNRFVCLFVYICWIILIFLWFLLLKCFQNCSICHRRVTYRIRQRLMIATDKF